MSYPVRKYPRLKSFDYAAGGVFCVTICTRNKEKRFGYVVDGEVAQVVLNELGQLAQSCLDSIEESYPGVRVLNRVVMPNHIHLLLQIAPESKLSLMTVVRSYKTIVSKQWGVPLWQRSFYEHVVRGEADALRYWKYIDENPKKWTLDQYFIR